VTVQGFYDADMLQHKFKAFYNTIDLEQKTVTFNIPKLVLYDPKIMAIQVQKN
jgi:hypothetical protein